MNILLGWVKLGADPQLKEMDEINPESARTDVAVAFGAPARRGGTARRAAAADREHGAC